MRRVEQGADCSHACADVSGRSQAHLSCQQVACGHMLCRKTSDSVNSTGGRHPQHLLDGAEDYVILFAAAAATAVPPPPVLWRVNTEEFNRQFRHQVTPASANLHHCCCCLHQLLLPALST